MMKIDRRGSSLILFVLGALVFAVFLIVISSPPASLTALGRVVHGDIHPLQDDSTGLAIFGLAIAAAITLGVTGTAASFGMATTSTAALGAITEKPENFGRSILYVVFIEAIAIYGFVIAFLLIGYIPDLIGT